MSFVYTDTDHFAKLSRVDDDLELKTQQSQYQSVDKTWSVNVDGTDQVEEADQVVEDDMIASDEGIGTTQLDFAAVRGDSVYHTGDSVNSMAVNTLQNRSLATRMEETYGVAASISAIVHQSRSVSNRTQQERSYKKITIVVNVLRVPDL